MLSTVFPYTQRGRIYEDESSEHKRLYIIELSFSSKPRFAPVTQKFWKFPSCQLRFSDSAKKRNLIIYIEPCTSPRSMCVILTRYKIHKKTILENCCEQPPLQRVNCTSLNKTADRNKNSTKSLRAPNHQITDQQYKYVLEKNIWCHLNHVRRPQNEHITINVILKAKDIKI